MCVCVCVAGGRGDWAVKGRGGSLDLAVFSPPALSSRTGGGEPRGQLPDSRTAWLSLEGMGRSVLFSQLGLCCASSASGNPHFLSPSF